MAILSNYSRRRDRRDEACPRSTKSSTTIRLPGTKGGETRRRPSTIWLIPAITGRRRRGPAKARGFRLDGSVAGGVTGVRHDGRSWTSAVRGEEREFP